MSLINTLEGEPIGSYRGGFDSSFRFENAAHAIWAKGEPGVYDGTVPTYPRNGSKPLHDLETGVSRLVNAEGSYFYYLNSGISAAPALVESTFPTKGDIIVYSPKIYGKTGIYFNKLLKNRGVKIERLNSLKPSELEEQLKFVVERNPGSKVKAAWIEVVGNGLGMPVADVEAIMDLNVWQELAELRDTRLFFDNTLATNVVIPVAKYLRERPAVKAAQGDSATKFIEDNKSLGGFVLSYNHEVGEVLWEQRTVLGYTPDEIAARSSLSHIPQTKEEYEKYILIAAANTARLAQAIAEVAGDRLRVTYPGLENHPDHELAKKWHPRGWIAPTLFMAPVPGDPFSVQGLYCALDNYGGFGEIQHTDSFGFKRAGVYYNTVDPSLRLSGGQETRDIVERQAEQIQEALVKVLR